MFADGLECDDQKIENSITCRHIFHSITNLVMIKTYVMHDFFKVVNIYFNGCYFHGHVYDAELISKTIGKYSQFSKNEKT